MAQVAPGEHELRRVIDEDREVEGLGEQELLDLYRSMVLLRTYDERSLVYHRQGRLGTYAMFWNHEAMQAGSAHALAREDWIFPSYREGAIGLLRGIPASTLLSWWRGHPAGWWNPSEFNVASICVPIATQVPHAAGLAWGKKLKGESAVAIVYFGDGATSEGAFHEGANLAAVMQAPLVLFCNNNQWAISTPLSAQTHADALVDKAAGYGIPGIRVDGGDVLAVFEATREAVERARGGGGPTFIEAAELPRRAARDGGRSARVHRSRAGRAGEAERVPRPLRALPAEARRPRRRPGGVDQGGRARGDAHRDHGGGGEAGPGHRPRLRARVRESARVVRGRAGGAAAHSRRRGGMSRLFMIEAINDAFQVELARDDSVMVLGEDVGRSGGVFRATAGLRDRFGADRCVDMPLAEAGILGGAVGLCMAGWRPVCEMQYDAFSYPCLDQLINHVGRYHWRTGGTMEFPLVVRMPYGGGVRAPELHDDSPETYYVHTPGVKVAIPSTPADAKGLLAAAIRDPDPVVLLEPKLIYRTERAEVPEGEHVVPLGQARLAREGTDVTLVAYGAMVPLCERVADELDGEASIEVLDVRTLKPLDEDALLASAAKTGRVVIVQEAPRTAGFGAELAAILAEKAILDLHGPVLRVTGFDVPYPYWRIEDAYMPSAERVVDAVRKLLEF